MKTVDKVIDRIRKLFRLSQSDNPHEAANALARAQRLMMQHRIEQCQLADPEEDEIKLWQDEPIDSGHTIPPWKQAIGGAIAELNDCLCLVSDRRIQPGNLRVMMVAGRRSDFEACVAMYEWIIGTIDRLALGANRRLGETRYASAGLGRRWLNSFRHGAGTEVEDRLYAEQRAQRAQLREDPKIATALDIRREEVYDWAKENIDTRAAQGRTAGIDEEAYALGARAGRVMPLRGDGSG